MSAFGAPIWSSGFRPFYILGAIAGPLFMVELLRAGLAGGLGEIDRLRHGHEMIFGFAGAMCAGFVLTALPSWAGTCEIARRPLALLVALWIAGRIAMLQQGAWPAFIVGALDIALYLALALMVLPDLLKAQDKRYLAILPILLGLSLGNGLYHLGLGTGRLELAHLGLRLAVAWQMTLFTLASGALTQVFTETALRDREPNYRLPFRAPLEYAALAATLASGHAWAFWPGSWISGGLALLAVIAHGLRFGRWQTRQILDVPLVWILHLAYGFLIFSFVLRALADGPRLVPDSAALHAFTAGALSLTVIGIMTRVALKHTGRPLHPPKAMIVGFLVMAAASVMRFVAAETEQAMAIALSAILWSIPFAAFLYAHGRTLIVPSLPREYKAPIPPQT